MAVLIQTVTGEALPTGLHVCHEALNARRLDHTDKLLQLSIAGMIWVRYNLITAHELQNTMVTHSTLMRYRTVSGYDGVPGAPVAPPALTGMTCIHCADTANFCPASHSSSFFLLLSFNTSCCVLDHAGLNWDQWSDWLWSRRSHQEWFPWARSGWKSIQSSELVCMMTKPRV